MLSVQLQCTDQFTDEFVVAQSVDRVDLASELQHLSADIIEESDTLSDTGLLLLPTLRYLADVVREQHHHGMGIFRVLDKHVKLEGVLLLWLLQNWLNELLE